MSTTIRHYLLRACSEEVSTPLSPALPFSHAGTTTHTGPLPRRTEQRSRQTIVTRTPAS